MAVHIRSGQYVVLFDLLHIVHWFQKFVKVLFESLEDAAWVFGCAVVSYQMIKTFRQRHVWNRSTVGVVIVDEDHAVLGMQSHLFREHVNELDQQLLSTWSSRVINKDDSISILLNWTITLFIFQISANVPELNVYFSEVSHWSWSFSLEVNDPVSLLKNYSLTYLTPAVGR